MVAVASVGCVRSDPGLPSRTTRSTQVARKKTSELTQTKLLKQAGSPKQKGTGSKGGGDGTGGTGGGSKSRGTAGAAAGAAPAHGKDEDELRVKGRAATGGAKAAKQDGAEERKVVREVRKEASSTSKPGFRVGMPGNVRPVSLTLATTLTR